MTETIDVTPTWSALMTVYARMAESGQQAFCQHMRSEVLRAAAAADALKALVDSKTLTGEQQALIAPILAK